MGDIYVLIAGSRDLGYTSLVPAGQGYVPCSTVLEALCTVALSHFKDHGNIHVVEGGARGADEAGKMWAQEKGYDVIEMPADWDKHGRAAGHIRNKEMAEFIKSKGSCLAIILWDGKSNGTANMIGNVKKFGIPYAICNFYTDKVSYSWEG